MYEVSTQGSLDTELQAGLISGKCHQVEPGEMQVSFQLPQLTANRPLQPFGVKLKPGTGLFEKAWTGKNLFIIFYTPHRLVGK